MDKRYIISALFCLGTLTGFAQSDSRMTTMDLTAEQMAHFMAPGWNLGNTMEGGSKTNCYANSGTSTETWWQSTKTSQKIINLVAAQGFKSVRIPCAWVMGHITDKDNMTIDPAWITRVKEIIDYCINANLNVVINDHWDGGWLEYDGFTTGADVSDLTSKLTKLWTNIATALKDYDERVMFAGLNEPGVGDASPNASGSLMINQYGSNSDDVMSAFVSRIQTYEQAFINAVRATGGNNAKRILIVQGPQVDVSKTVKYFDPSKLTDSASDRLMVEIHYYSPYQFCQMDADASWGKMQFYWAGSDYNLTSSTHAGTYYDSAVTDEMESLKSAFVDKGYPVIAGEFGAFWRDLSSYSDESQDKHNNSLQYWYKLLVESAMENGIVPFHWDTNNCNTGGCSSINRAKCEAGISYIVNGIAEGTSAGQTTYDALYPVPAAVKVATPTAVVQNGVATLSCSEDGVSYEYEIVSQSASISGNQLTMPSQFSINVYATKSGFSKSDPLTLTIQTYDVNGDGQITISDVSALVQKLLNK